jgi:cellulose synthase/poly-beta-1,6-N-acetylglucosamine synthase-like glycosyltransferase
MLTIALISTFSYFFCILSIIVYWTKIENFKWGESTKKASVIVALHNEEKNIDRLVHALDAQSLSKDRFEVILVDDYSTDATWEIISDYAAKLPYICTIQNTLNRGKKQALSEGIKCAQNDILIFTDADCVPSREWLEIYMDFFEKKNPNLVFGAVLIDANGLFGEIQQIEFASLVLAGASTWQMGIPTMCNGANLAYSKSFFEKINGFETHKHLLSGDDEFTYHKAIEIDKSKVFYLKNEKHYVYTDAASSWSKFYNQRKRWASKWEHYTISSPKWVAVLVFLFNLFFISLPIWTDWKTALGCLILRFSIDYVAINQWLMYYGKKVKIHPYIIICSVYPIYVVFFGLISRFIKNNKW